MSSARAQRRPAGQAEHTPKAAIAAEHRISFAARLAGTENHAQDQGNPTNVGSDGENMSRSRGRRSFHRPQQSRPLQSYEIANLFQKAVTFHQQGELAQAETWYQA